MESSRQAGIGRSVGVRCSPREDQRNAKVSKIFGTAICGFVEALAI
jgi:hypothetical protein